MKVTLELEMPDGTDAGEVIALPCYRSHPNAGVDAILIVKAPSGGFQLPEQSDGEQTGTPGSGRETTGPDCHTVDSGRHTTDERGTARTGSQLAHLRDAVDHLFEALDQTSFTALEGLRYGG